LQTSAFNAFSPGFHTDTRSHQLRGSGYAGAFSFDAGKADSSCPRLHEADLVSSFSAEDDVPILLHHCPNPTGSDENEQDLVLCKT